MRLRAARREISSSMKEVAYHVNALRLTARVSARRGRRNVPDDTMSSHGARP